MRFLLILLAMCLCAVTSSTQDWDFAGVQGKVGLEVRSGLGEPLDMRAVPMEPGVLPGAVAMRIDVGKEMIRFHVRGEIDSYDDVHLPECADSARVIILSGTDFVSEFFEVDTVMVYLDPSPLKLLATDARVRRIPGEQTLQVTGFRQQRSRGQRLSGSQTSLTFTFENIELVDATGERIALSLIKDDEAVATGGRFLDHTLDVGMKRVDGRPPIGKISGTFEVVMSGMRSVCGRRSAVRTVRKHLAVD